MLTRLREKSFYVAFGRRNRLPYHGISSIYGQVGQAVPPVRCFFRSL